MFSTFLGLVPSKYTMKLTVFVLGFTGSNSPVIDRKSDLLQTESQLVTEVQNTFDEEDEFSR